MRVWVDPALFNFVWNEKDREGVGCHDFEDVLIRMGRLTDISRTNRLTVDTTVVHKSWEFMFGTRPKITRDQALMLTGVVITASQEQPIAQR